MILNVSFISDKQTLETKIYGVRFMPSAFTYEGIFIELPVSYSFFLIGALFSFLLIVHNPESK